MDKKCPYDGSYLTAPLPSKGNLSTYSPDGICLECNHVEYSSSNYLKKSCSCLNCKKEEVREKETVVKVIRDVYKDPVELNELSVMDRLHITALLQNGSEIEVEDGEELISIWKDLVKRELYKLFKFQMEELRFTRELGNAEQEKKIFNAFDRWFEFYSPSQIYAILYKVIRDADNQRTSNKWGNYSYHEIDFIVKLADQMIVRYEKEEWGIKSYNYPYQLEFDIQTKLFFSKVAKEKNWFNELVPAPEKI